MNNRKVNIAIVLVLLMALFLAACGTEKDVPGVPEQEDASHLATPAVIEFYEEPDGKTEELDPLAVAESMVGEPVADLIIKIGDPIYTDYAPSCLGNGEDGELGYEGFTVYTYREGDYECIEEVVRAK